MPSSEEVRARRARRRQKTLTIAKRRRDEHLNRNHFNATTGLTQVDCVCELSNTYFAKVSSFGCTCSKRRKGRPRVSKGMCCIGERDRIYEWRQAARKLRADALAGRGVEEERFSHPTYSKNKPPKTFILEKQDISRGGLEYGWFIYRKYRTAAGRACALAQLQKNVLSYHEGHPHSAFRAKPEEE